MDAKNYHKAKSQSEWYVQAHCCGSANMSYLDRIDFSVATAEYYRSNAVCEVTTHEIFKKGLIVEGGPCDLRMGSFGRQSCQTCHRLLECHGHFGMIELAAPMYNITYQSKMKDILSCLCLRCNRLNVGRTDVIKEWADVMRAVKTRKECLHCNAQRPVVRRNGGYIYVTGLAASSSLSAGLAGALTTTASSTHKQRLLASDAFANHLCRLPEEDIELITRLHNGIDPRAFLFTVWPVIPNTERPSFDAGDTGDTRSMDKLTFRIANIVELNKALANIINGVTPNLKPDARNNAELLLQDTITLFYTEDHLKGSYLLQKKVTNASLPQSRQGIDEGRPIFSRIQGKEGQLRSGLMGKRVNYTGRTVATGDPTLHLDEVGLPQHFANILTIPVKIWQFNIAEWQQKVQQRDPSIRRIVRVDGAIIQFQQATKSDNITLEYGDTVERCLKDGDAVILNRQPTLHRPSFLAMKTKIRPADIKTIGMNVIITKP